MNCNRKFSLLSCSSSSPYLPLCLFTNTLPCLPTLCLVYKLGVGVCENLFLKEEFLSFAEGISSPCVCCEFLQFDRVAAESSTRVVAFSDQ